MQNTVTQQPAGVKTSDHHRSVCLVAEILFLDVIWQFGGLQYFDLFWGFLDLGVKLGSEGYVFCGAMGLIIYLYSIKSTVPLKLI